LTLKGKPPAPPFGIANFKIRMKIIKNNNKGHTSDKSVTRHDFSLNFTSTITGPVSDIHKSLSDVPMGFLVVNTFTYCSVRFFLTVIKETDEPVPRYWYHLSEVSSSKAILVNVPAVYCFKKSLSETSLVSRTTSRISPCTLIVLYAWIAPVITRINSKINQNHFFIVQKKYQIKLYSVTI